MRRGQAVRAAVLTNGGPALASLTAAFLALGVAELVAGVVGRPVSPVIVVGGATVDRTPRFLKEFAIEQFGAHDKQVLLGGIVVVIGLLAVAAGILAVRRPALGRGLVALLGLVAAAAAASRPSASVTDVLPSLVAAGVGAAVLVPLVRAAAPVVPAAGTGEPAVVPERAEERFEDGGQPDRADPRGIAPGRRGLLLVGAVAVLGAVSGMGGRFLQSRRVDVEASRRAVVLPRPRVPAPAVPAEADLSLDGLSPLFTPTDDFYRVDTALFVPRLPAEEWRLRVHGMVDREISLSFDDLLSRPVVEHDITLTCVSNEVGGDLLGTARWLGVELAPLLREAGVRAGADQLVSRSVDGMTIGTPVAAVMDGRDAMLAFSMNGEPLQPEHGFPVRMVVPGLYGYVSATKWVVDLELSTFAAYDAYWIERKWDVQPSIKTGSRVDTPKPFTTLKPGRVTVAGVAWAQHRGISAVEVRVDSGPWQPARLSPSIGEDVWRQWVLEWEAEPGRHTLEVRAIDADGQVQPEERATPFPSGATGWHSVLVTVA